MYNCIMLYKPKEKNLNYTPNDYFNSCMSHIKEDLTMIKAKDVKVSFLQ